MTMCSFSLLFLIQAFFVFHSIFLEKKKQANFFVLLFVTFLPLNLAGLDAGPDGQILWTVVSANKIREFGSFQSF